MTLTFGSLFAGVGGFDAGLERAGMRCLWQAERDEQCQNVLAKHWPEVERLDDVRDVSATRLVRPEWICGGFPCQDLSVAGKRAGLAGERSGLFFEFMRIVGEFAPSGVLIENVPGLLSSNGGNDMAVVLRSLAELGYGFAYRILDAQWFGVPQRRRRVFIVGCLGDWRRAAEILFERESLPWDSPPCRKTGSRIAASLTRGADSGGRGGYAGRRREDDVSGTPLVPFTFDPRQVTSKENRTTVSPDGPCGTLHEMPQAVTYAIQERASAENLTCGPQSKGYKEDQAYCLEARHTTQAVAFQASDYRNGEFEQCDTARPLTNSPDRSRAAPIVGGFKRGQGAKARSDGYQVEQSLTLTSTDSGTQQSPGVHIGMAVRRLTPRECERLQGFDDDWTRWGVDGSEISDSARYRMLGNAVCVNVSEWIGRRLIKAPLPTSVNQTRKI